MVKIEVIGAGGWGTTLANLLSEKGHDVKVWAFSKEVCDDININHKNSKYLKDVELNSNLVCSNDLGIVKKVEFIVFATPSEFIREIAKKVNAHLEDREYKLVSVTKGLEHETFKLMSEVLADSLRFIESGLDFDNFIEYNGQKVLFGICKSD